MLDIDQPDLERYPAFRHVRPIECYLEPGDVLFIPGQLCLIHICTKSPLPNISLV